MKFHALSNIQAGELVELVPPDPANAVLRPLDDAACRTVARAINTRGGDYITLASREDATRIHGIGRLIGFASAGRVSARAMRDAIVRWLAKNAAR